VPGGDGVTGDGDGRPMRVHHHDVSPGFGSRLD
jgi:hypothetical protein